MVMRNVFIHANFPVFLRYIRFTLEQFLVISRVLKLSCNYIIRRETANIKMECTLRKIKYEHLLPTTENFYAFFLYLSWNSVTIEINLHFSLQTFFRYGKVKYEHMTQLQNKVCCRTIREHAEIVLIKVGRQHKNKPNIIYLKLQNFYKINNLYLSIHNKYCTRGP